MEKSIIIGTDGNLIESIIGLGKQDKHGFPNRTDSTLSFVDGTRTFTITGTNFIVFNQGILQTKNTENIVIPNTKGTHYIYYNSSNILVASTTPWVIGVDMPISIVIWNGTNGLICEERHGLFDTQTHLWAHSVFHTLYASGLAGNFTNTTFSVDNGIIFDEDIKITIPTTTSARVFYRDTGAASFTWTGSQTNYNLISATMYYDNAGTLTAVPSNNYIAVWVYGTDIENNGIIFVLGQRQDNTIANARANNTPESISTANLPPEFKLLYRVIVKNDATPYQETTDYRATSVTGSSVTVTDHQTLSNRSAIDSHPINAITGLTNAGAGTLFLADDGTYKSAGGGGGSSTILSSQTLTAASWTLSSGLYQYTFSNAGILSTSIITVTPLNASIDIVIASQMLPYITVSAGSIIMYAKYLPSANITVDIGIES